VNDLVSRGLVPPRPNLGPEPWQDPHPLIRALPWLIFLVFMVLVFFIGRRFRGSRVRSRQGRLRPGALTESNPSPRDRLVGLSASIREALTVPFGTACRALTTEELAADSRLEKLLGDQDLHELIRFLDQVDRLKFAPERSNHQKEILQEELTTWEPRVEFLRDRIRSKPRERAKHGGPRKRFVRQGTTP